MKQDLRVLYAGSWPTSTDDSGHKPTPCRQRHKEFTMKIKTVVLYTYLVFSVAAQEFVTVQATSYAVARKAVR